MVLLEDLVEDILLRLAVEDVLRCKSICKSWYSLISTSGFAKAHLKQHTCNSSNTNNELGHVRIAMPTYWKVPNERAFQFDSWSVVGSSNGLVCFSPLPVDNLILVNNPWTRELRKLPSVLQTEASLWDTCLSFGYDSSTDDYKVVMGIWSSMTNETLIKVFSLKSNTWKSIVEFKYRLFRNRPGILFNGALHWLASDYNNVGNKRRVILSFDLSREEFTALFPEPDDSKFEFCINNFHYYVGIVEDQLCLFFRDGDYDPPCNIWVIRSCNGERFWELLPDNYEMKYEVVHHMKIIESISSKKKRMSFFCDDNKCFSRAWNHINAHLFVPSLVSPYAARPSHAKNYKKSIKSWTIKGFEGERQHSQATIRRFILKGASEPSLKKIEAVYRQEVGETENYYFHEEGYGEIEEILCAEGVKNKEREKQEEQVK